MKITKQKLAEIIKEEIASAISEEDAYEIGAPDEAGETVVDMTGREYTVDELRGALSDVDLTILMKRPNAYFVRIRDGRPSGIGPD